MKTVSHAPTRWPVSICPKAVAMKVRIDLAGFGDDRPAVFGDANGLDMTLGDDATLETAMAVMGLDTTPGLSILINERPVGGAERETVPLCHGDHIVVLHAFEGG